MAATVDEEGNALITCDCGKPIVRANEFGMFCEDKCGMKESIKIAEDFTKIVTGIKSE